MSIALPREDRTAVGVAIMALAVLFFTGIDTSAKWLILAGLAPIQVVFLRYAVHFLWSLVIYVPQEGPSAFVSNAPRRQLLRSVFLFASTILNFTALKYLPITLTTTIAFASPIVVTLMAIPILGEVVGLRRILAVCTGFLGVLIAVRPWGVEFHPAVFLSLGALCSSSGYFVMTRMLAGVETNATAQIWSSGLATLCLAPFGIMAWVAPQTPLQFAVILGLGTFGALGHISATIASRLADASILAPVIYIQIVLAGLAGVLVFDTWPTVWTLGGGLVIIAAGLYIWHRERNRPGSVRPASRSIKRAST
jgi:drug/metabolite transporter (DMT)-like permease